MSESDDTTDMHSLIDALEAVIAAADPAKREALATAIDAYAEDCPDEFYWAIGAQAPALLYHLFMMIDAACRPESRSKPRPVLRIVDRKPESGT